MLNKISSMFVSLLRYSKYIPFNFYIRGLNNSKKVRNKKIILNSNKVTRKYDILFISDFHIDVVNNLETIINEISFKKYDLILFAGDYIDRDENFNLFKNDYDCFLKKIENNSKNIFIVFGNHDKEFSKKYFNKYNIENNIISYEELNIFGVGINNKKEEKKANSKKFNLVLSHIPEQIKNFRGFDLFLCGHTHWGQIAFFNIAPIKNTKIKKCFKSLWFYNNTKGYTTSGIGSSGYPLRFGSTPEIVEICILEDK